MTALLGKKITVGTSGLGEFVDQIESGQLRVLAVSGSERVEDVDAPTLTEAGIDLTFTNWRGILAPPGISDDAKQALVKVLEELHGTDQWKEALVKNGWTDAFETGARVRAVPQGPGQPGLVDPDRIGAAMTTTNEPQEHAVEKTVDKAQYLVCAVLVAVGAIPDLSTRCRWRRVSRRWIRSGRGCSRSPSASA